jgi:hypothetical protein
MNIFYHILLAPVYLLLAYLCIVLVRDVYSFHRL